MVRLEAGLGFWWGIVIIAEVLEEMGKSRVRGFLVRELGLQFKLFIPVYPYFLFVAESSRKACCSFVTHPAKINVTVHTKNNSLIFISPSSSYDLSESLKRITM